MSILNEIVEKLRPRLMGRKQRLPLEQLVEQARRCPPRPSFQAAFNGEGMRVIAEIKSASPSKGIIRRELDVPSLALELEQGGAAALSILTEPNYFLGDESYLELAAAAVSLPLLRKDFIFDEYQIAEAKLLGASCVLLIAAMLPRPDFYRLLDFAHSLGLAVLGEAHTEKELEIALAADLVGVNARDLHTFDTSLKHSAELLRLIPQHKMPIAESAVKSLEDMKMLTDAGARGFLIGETLMRAEHPGLKLKEILQCC